MSDDIEWSFIEKMLFEIMTNKYWIPTKQEMLNAGVINGFLDLNLMPVEYVTEKNSNDVNEILKSKLR